jgi:hypothetical protein
MLQKYHLGLYALITTALTNPLHNATSLKRDAGDVFTIGGYSGTLYWALIRSQNNLDSPPYDESDSLTAWDNAINEIVQNLDGTEIASQTELEDGNTIIVSGNMINGETWASIGDAAEWQTILVAVGNRNEQENYPEYFYVTIGTSEDTVNFLTSISLSWINTA